jgi:hypothetical protein
VEETQAVQVPLVPQEEHPQTLAQELVVLEEQQYQVTVAAEAVEVDIQVLAVLEEILLVLEETRLASEAVVVVVRVCS